MEDLDKTPTRPFKQPRRQKWTKRRIPTCIRLEVEQSRQVKKLSGKLKLSKNRVHNDAIEALYLSVFKGESGE